MAFFQSAVGTLQTFVIALRRNGRMSLTRPAAGGESCRAGFFFITLPLRRRFCFYRFFLQFLPIYLMIKNVRFYKNLMIYILFLSFEYIF